MSKSKLLSNIHEAANFVKSSEKVHLTTGKYDYYHYLCDGFDDRGWGYSYRTLQTICSWMTYNYEDAPSVPSIRDIQNILVQMEDKPQSFLGSRQWIGSFEVCLVIEKLYDIPCKIVHIMYKCEELKDIMGTLVNHFDTWGSPVMMGGDVDYFSKGIMGIDISGSEPSLLVLDPHYVGKDIISKEYLWSNGWIKWQPLSDFLNSSFYNLCLPQAKAKCKVG